MQKDHWCNKIKVNHDGSSKKLKTRMVVKGFSQMPIINKLKPLHL
jgi:predicted transcriptional regulator